MPSLTKWLDDLLLFRGPYDIAQLAEIRMHLLLDMKERGFDHYLQQMDRFRQATNVVLADDALVEDDDYWTRPGGLCEHSYWQEESPWLRDMHQTLFRSSSGSVAVSTSLLSETVVEQLIGTADWMTVQQKILFKTLIFSYFRSNIRLWPVHLNMDFTFLQTRQREKTKSNLVNRFKTLFKSLLSGSGPFILKILQQINTANDSRIGGQIAVSDLTRDIFSTVPPLTPAETQVVLDALALDPSYLTPPHYDPHVLGSASIAETHRSFSTHFDRPAVIKFIKPVYAYYFLCEINFLLADAWRAVARYSKGNRLHLKQSRKLLIFFVKEFIKEFDYYGEFVNTTVGYKFYNHPQQHVSSIVALDCHINPFPVLVLSFVAGRSVDGWMEQSSVTKAHLATLYRNVDNLVKIWFKNTLWGNGFFHADLHPGNLIVGPDQTVYIIDFGSCGVLTPAEQCAMITAMVISGQFVNMEKRLHDTPQGRKAYQTNLAVAERFVTAIWNVCQVQAPQAAHRRDVARQIVDLRFGNPEGGFYFSTLFLDIVKISDDIGLCTNSAVLLFGRACAYIGSLMKRIETRCADQKMCPQWGVDGIVASNMFRHPWQLAHFFAKGTVC